MLGDTASSTDFATGSSEDILRNFLVTPSRPDPFQVQRDNLIPNAIQNTLADGSVEAHDGDDKLLLRGERHGFWRSASVSLSRLIGHCQAMCARPEFSFNCLLGRMSLEQ